MTETQRAAGAAHEFSPDDAAHFRAEDDLAADGDAEEGAAGESVSNAFTEAYARAANDDAPSSGANGATDGEAANGHAGTASDAGRSDGGAEAGGEAPQRLNGYRLVGHIEEAAVYSRRDVVGGDVDTALNSAVLNRVVTVASGREREDKEWLTHSRPFGELVQAHFVRYLRSNEKDNICITNGGLSGPRRLRENLRHNSLAYLDGDGCLDLDEALELATRLGLFTILSNTHSHGKTRTEIKEKPLLKWLRETDRFTGHPGDVTAQHCADYLHEKRGIKRSVLADLELSHKPNADNKVTYVIKHQPMPRVRLMFVLKEDFDFTIGGREQRIDEWKGKYGGLVAKTGYPFDLTCADPVKINYLPCAPLDAKLGPGGHQLIIVDGDFLDLAQIQAAPSGGTDSGRKRSGAGRRGTANTMTADLLRIVKLVGPGHFQASDFMLHHFGARHDYKDGVKRDHRCPNEEEHSKPDAKDRGFFACNANAERDWSMFCPHNVCQEGSQNDRLWFLDMALQELELTAEAVLDFCGERGAALKRELAQRREAKRALEDELAEINEQLALWETAAKFGGDREAVALAIGKLNNGSSDDDRLPVLRALAARPDGGDRDKLIKQLVATGINQRTVNAQFKVLRAERDGLEKRKQELERLIAEVMSAATDAEAPDMPEGAIDVTHGFKERLAAATAAMTAARFRGHSPRFYRGAGGVVTRLREVEDSRDDSVSAECLDKNAVRAELNRIADWRTPLKGGGSKSVSASPDVVDQISSDIELELSKLRGIARSPIITASGEQVATPGYHSASGIYLNPLPGFTAIPVTPDEVTKDGAIAARDRVLDVLRDFPFSDTFDGTREGPAYLDVTDADGRPLPNLKRGRGSRAGALTAILHPHLMAFFDSASPLYGIDASASRSGKGTLADTVTLISEGRAVPKQDFPASPTETSKVITSALMEQMPALCLDNIRKVFEDTALELSITAGIHSGRLLGQSKMIVMPMRVQLLATLNNGTYGDDMKGRVVPIRLQPDQRNRERQYKWPDYNAHILSKRAQLIHDLHLIILWWLKQGGSDGSVKFQGFIPWSRTMSGILQEIDMPYLLGNQDAFYAKGGGNAGGPAEAFVADWWKQFPDKAVTASQLLAAFTEEERVLGFSTPVFKHPDLPGLNLAARDLKVSFGLALAALTGQPYKVDDGADVFVTRATKPEGGSGGWQLVRRE